MLALDVCLTRSQARRGEVGKKARGAIRVAVLVAVLMGVSNTWHIEKNVRVPLRPHLVALLISQNGGVEETVVISKPINIQARVAYAGASGNVDSGL